MFKKPKQTEKALTGPSLADRRPDFLVGNILGLLPDLDPVLDKLTSEAEGMLEATQADGVTFSLIQTRKAAVLNREFRLKPGTIDGEVDTPSELLARDFMADLDGLDVRSLIGQILDAPLFGFVPIELNWRADSGKLRLAELRPLPRSWFGFSINGELMFRPFGGVPEPLNPAKVVTARVGATFIRPYGQRALTRCIWPVAFKKGGLKAWVKLAEDLNLPLMIGKYPSGTPDDQQTALLNALSAARASGTAVVDQGVEVDVVSVSKSGGAGVHKELQVLMDSVIARVITGQTLSHDIGSSGSRAAAQVHYEVMKDIQQADMALVKSVLTQIAKIYRDLNNSQAQAPELIWYEEEDPQREWADRDQVLSQAGVKFTKSYFKDKYGFDNDDFDLVGPQAAAMNSTPQSSPNSPAFTEGLPAGLVGELDKPLQPVARWGIDQSRAEQAELLGLAQSTLGEAQSFAEISKLMADLATPGAGEPLAVSMAAGAKLGTKKVQRGTGG